MSNDAGWAIYSLLLGWTLAPVVLVLVTVLVAGGLTAWRYFVPYPPPNLPVPPPLPPWPYKPPLTDEELIRRMTKVRTMRKRQARGLV